MGFTKITSEDLADKGVVGLPDTPGLTTGEMQEKFDEIALDVIVPKFNNLVDELDGKDIDERVTSEDITNIRLSADKAIQVSDDGGETWEDTASSGHLIMDGSGTTYPQRGRMQYSANVVVSDDAENNRTFLSISSGEKGDKGDGATIRVGNVTKGAEAKVTNVGSVQDAVFNFELPQGEDGSAATIQVGTVTSGQTASVNNRGTSSAAIFDFVLPRGEKGDAGTSFQILGQYATYAELIAAHPTGNRGEAYAVGTASNNTVYNWDVDANEWVDLGPIRGAKGDDGDAATITIGTVTEGNTVAVENVGTTSEAILNFTLKKGDKGDTGNAATISVGDVEEGDTASVVNSGTATNAVFDFVIPRGEKGDQGDPVSINGKSGISVTLFPTDLVMTDYEEATEVSDIDEEDTLSEAVGKLEKKADTNAVDIDNIEDAIVDINTALGDKVDVTSDTPLADGELENLKAQGLALNTDLTKSLETHNVTVNPTFIGTGDCKATNIGKNRISINLTFPTTASGSSATSATQLFTITGITFNGTNYGMAKSLSGTNNVLFQTDGANTLKILSGTFKNSEWYSLDMVANIQ